MRRAVFHVNFEEISSEIQTLEKIDLNLQNELVKIVDALKNIDSKLDQALSQEPLEANEKELWSQYQELQRDKLSLVDLSHEWKPLKDEVDKKNHELAVLVDESIGESIDHITIAAEALRAHIDILEIKNSRRLSFMALIVSIIISYVALWEFFAREFILNYEFQGGLSPGLNYLILIASFAPMFVALYSAWRYREME